MSQTLDPWLVEILVCPETKAPLVLEGDWLYSTDPATRRRYAVQEGIPNMLIGESEVVSEEEFHRVMHKHGKMEKTRHDQAEA